MNELGKELEMARRLRVADVAYINELVKENKELRDIEKLIPVEERWKIQDQFEDPRDKRTCANTINFVIQAIESQINKKP